VPSAIGGLSGVVAAGAGWAPHEAL
jgi:hypothetical protein